MKSALVIGIADGFGLHTATALLATGWRVRALLREPDALPACLRGIDVFAGSSASIDDVRHAAAGVDVIVFGANPPHPRWHAQAVPALDTAAAVAETLGLTLVFPANQQVYDPEDGSVFDESARLHPVSRNGSIQQRMESRLGLASRRGARVIVLRTGDFIGAHSGSGWSEALIRPVLRGYRLLHPGPAVHVHTWANLPDVARTASCLLARRDELPDFAEFQFSGYRISFWQLAEAVSQASGKAVELRPFPKRRLNPLSARKPLARELKEMGYLWEHEIHLNDDRLRATLNEVPHTPLPEALTVAGLVASAGERNLHWSYVQTA
ncbi:MAG: NAD(P)H-binding protein [Acidihalobacter sp.]